MAARKADGANLDFEPMAATRRRPGTSRSSPGSATAMKARFPTATLVNATSAGAGKDLIVGLVPLVDRQMVMTYGYRDRDRDRRPARSRRSTTPRATSKSTSRGSCSGRRPSTVLLGVPYYGYDWPVTANVPNATVQSNKTNYGAVDERHVRERARLPRGPPRGRPALRRRSRAAATTPTGTRTKKTWRQVYFEDERASPPSTTTP